MLTEARRARLAAAMARFDMGIPLNDLNRAFDLGFRPFPWGEQGYIPTMMQAVGATATTSPKADTAQPGPQASGFRDQGSAGRQDPFKRLAAALTTKGNHR